MSHRALKILNMLARNSETYTQENLDRNREMYRQELLRSLLQDAEVIREGPAALQPAFTELQAVSIKEASLADLDKAQEGQRASILDNEPELGKVLPMGCGYSSSVSVIEKLQAIPGSPSPTPIKISTPILSAASKHPLETRIVQDEVVDTCVESPEPEDTLPEGDFIDGMLGIKDENIVQEMLASLGEDELFEDPDFPPEMSAVQDDLVTWQRPHEFCENPQMFVDGVSRSDVKQGVLGDCWFLCACAALSRRPDLIEKVVSPDQILKGEGYKGVVRIRFWRFGQWVTVYIDDRLPVKNGALLYASCTESNEFWVAFVEKAYAKIHGSYEALAGGHAIEAFVDLTGGLAEQLEITPEIFRRLRIAFSHGAFITCARRGECQTEGPKDTEVNGLVQGHAYTVTDVRRLTTTSNGTLQMVRIRNPWGDASEWTGAWSDRDPRWNEISEENKANLGVKAKDDGEFWMEFKDFQTEFQELTIATLGPDFDSDGITDPHGQVKVVMGQWMEDVNAGGCRNDLESFATNPQYLLTLTEPDDPDPENEVIPTAQHCSILIGLMQEHRRSEKNKELRMLSIAFFVYKTDSSTERLSAEYFLCVPEEGSSGVFTNSREVMGHFELEPGMYVIIPATFYPGRNRNFMLRVFAMKNFTLFPLE